MNSVPFFAFLIKAVHHSSSTYCHQITCVFCYDNFFFYSFLFAFFRLGLYFYMYVHENITEILANIWMLSCKHNWVSKCCAAKPIENIYSQWKKSTVFFQIENFVTGIYNYEYLKKQHKVDVIGEKYIQIMRRHVRDRTARKILPRLDEKHTMSLLKLQRGTICNRCRHGTFHYGYACEAHWSRTPC